MLCVTFWVWPEYPWVWLKQNVPKYARILDMIRNIRWHVFKRSACKVVRNDQDIAFVKLFNVVLWIYLGAYICFVRSFSGFWICQEYTRILIYVSMLLINAWRCLGVCQEQNLNLLYNLRNIYRYLRVFKILPNI